MIKYFISYEDLLEDNKLNREINFDSKELCIIRKTKEDKIRIEQLNRFGDLKSSFEKLIQKDNYTKKSLLLVELTEKEKDMFSPILIKKYENQEDGSFKKVLNDETVVNLIDYNIIKNMRPSELVCGEVVSLMPCVSDPNNFYISLDREKTNDIKDIRKRRNILNNLELGCDIYFHTNDDTLLERYKDYTTTLKEKKFHTYELVEHKVFVVDSLSQDRMIDWTYPTFKIYNELCFNSVPVNIIEKDGKFELNIHKLDTKEKRGYVITRDINTLFYNKSIEPLLKYINVYVYIKGNYTKISLIDYLEQKDILKYIKKPKN